MRNGLPMALLLACWCGCSAAAPSTSRAPEIPREDERRSTERPVETATPAPSSAPQAVATDAGAPAAPRERSVGVRGITGSLTAFEVEQAMNKRTTELLGCVKTRRPRSLGHVAGDIAFYIALDGKGVVERVAVTHSDLGSALLEQCLSEVVATAPFPVPAGAERAETEWRMSVDPLSKAAPSLESAALEDAIANQAAASFESCSIGKAQRFEVTGYLGAKHKLHPVSVRVPWKGPKRTADIAPEQLACLASELERWTRWPKQRGYSKASFELRWMPPPPPVKRKRGAPARHKARS